MTLHLPGKCSATELHPQPQPSAAHLCLFMGFRPVIQCPPPSPDFMMRVTFVRFLNFYILINTVG